MSVIDWMLVAHVVAFFICAPLFLAVMAQEHREDRIAADAEQYGRTRPEGWQG